MNNEDRTRQDRLEHELAELDRLPDADVRRRIAVLNDLAWELVDTDSEQAFALSQAAQALASTPGADGPLDRGGLAHSLRTQGYLNQRFTNYALGISQLTQALALLESLQSTDGLADVYDGLAGIYAQLALYPEALGYMHKQLAAAEQLGDRRRMGNAYNNFAFIYVEMDQLERALEVLHLNLATAVAIGDARVECLSHINLANVLKFPAVESTAPVTATALVTIEAILPGSEITQTFTMTPGAYSLPDRLVSATHPMPIQYSIDPKSNYGYITWNNFTEPQIEIAVLKQFLEDIKHNPNLDGIMLDLRGNGGGWDLLYLTMASYFFNADKPVSMHWNDQDSFDANAGKLVREQAREYLLSAPEPDLHYGGPVVILVDQNCASSCEFFTQFMQTNKRATVVAQHGTAGAGAPINRVSLPFGMVFQYTKGRSYFAGTDKLNLEGTGVVPDVRVPVTVESLQATQAGQDPVLAAGLEVMNKKAGEAVVAGLKLVPIEAAAGAPFKGVQPEGWIPGSRGEAITFTAPDQRHQLSYQGPTDQDAAAILAPLGVTDPAAALLDKYTANGVEWSLYGVDLNGFSVRDAIAEIDGKTYVIGIGTPAGTADPLIEGLLKPAVDAFKAGKGS